MNKIIHSVFCLPSTPRWPSTVRNKKRLQRNDLLGSFWTPQWPITTDKQKHFVKFFRCILFFFQNSGELRENFILSNFELGGWQETLDAWKIMESTLMVLCEIGRTFFLWKFLIRCLHIDPLLLGNVVILILIYYGERSHNLRSGRFPNTVEIIKCMLVVRWSQN